MRGRGPPPARTAPLRRAEEEEESNLINNQQSDQYGDREGEKEDVFTFSRFEEEFNFFLWLVFIVSQHGRKNGFITSGNWRGKHNSREEEE